MDNERLIHIIEICLSCDVNAAETYRNFSETETDSEQKKFWLEMSYEEKDHVKYWENLLHMAQQHLIPNIFESQDKVVGELQKIQNEIEELSKNSMKTKTATEKFVQAFRTEILILYPVFESFFQISKTFTKNSPDVTYDKHLQKLIDAVDHFNVSSSELSLLSETVNKLWRINKKLVEQNKLDVLSGVLNRSGLFNTMTLYGFTSFQKQHLVGFIMVDIDHFKKVNDEHGHQVGDQVIRSVAQSIKGELRSKDLLGRFGGEEFLIFLPEIESDSLDKVAERIRMKIEEHTSQDSVATTASFGAVEGYFSGNIEQDIEMFIKHADECLYEAKNGGRNQVVHRVVKIKE